MISKTEKTTAEIGAEQQQQQQQQQQMHYSGCCVKTMPPPPPTTSCHHTIQYPSKPPPTLTPYYYHHPYMRNSQQQPPTLLPRTAIFPSSFPYNNHTCPLVCMNNAAATSGCLAHGGSQESNLTSATYSGSYIA